MGDWIMHTSARLLSEEEMSAVTGGLVVVVTAPGGGLNPGESGGYNPGFNGHYDVPTDTGDNGGGGGTGGTPTHEADNHAKFTRVDLNGDGKLDDNFYRDSEGKLYYDMKDAGGQHILYPAVLVNGTHNSPVTLAISLGDNGALPTATVTYSETQDKGSFNFQIDPTRGILVRPIP